MTIKDIEDLKSIVTGKTLNKEIHLDLLVKLDSIKEVEKSQTIVILTLKKDYE